MPFALALFAASTAPVAPHPEILLADRSIRAGDIAVVEAGENAVLGTMPSGRNIVEIDEQQRTRLLRNRLPGTPFRLRHTGPLVLRAPAAERTRNGTCFLARHDLASGTLLLNEDVAETPCAAEPVVRALGYDRERRMAIARGTIPAGSYLGAVRIAASEPVEQGASLTYRTSEGPVMVERQVEALQVGRPGRKIYVRTEDGEVIVAPLADLSEEDIP